MATSITTSYTGSSILVQFNITFECDSNTVFRLYRKIGDGTEIQIGTPLNDDGTVNTNYWSGIWMTGYDSDTASTPMTNHYMFFDTHGAAVGSSITYKLKVLDTHVVAGKFCLNRSYDKDGQLAYEVGCSSVILQEIY